MRNMRILAAILALLTVTGCAARQPAPDYAPTQQERLTVYTSHKEEVYLPIIMEFEQRTGIWVEVVTGGTNELLERIEAEQENVVADVMFGGGVESLESYRHCFTPYVCSESGRILEQLQPEDAFWTPFSALPVVLIYNTKLVSPQQLTDWDSLEDPAFAGRIAFADPAVSGSSFTALVTRLFAAGENREEAMMRLAENLRGIQQSSSGDVLTAVADGSCLVGITLEETALKRIADGADLAMVYPTSGTSCVPDASALVKGAPHSENAKKFLDFTASLEVQQLLSDRFYRRAVRMDVPAAQTLPPLSQIPLVDYDIGWASENRAAILSDWSFYGKEGA